MANRNSMDYRPKKYVLTNPDESFLTAEQAKFLLLEPLRHGWRRELVIRTVQKSEKCKRADIYYFSPEGVKLRSKREIGQYLLDQGLSSTYSAVYNFSFRQELFGGEFDPYESKRVSHYNGPTDSVVQNILHESNNPLAVPAEVSKELSSKQLRAPSDLTCICGVVPDNEMVRCTNEECVIGWYHHRCVNASKPLEVNWTCPICR